MKKYFFIYFLLSTCFLFAEENLKGLFDFKELPVDEIKADRFFIEPDCIKDSNYTDCLIYEIENTKGIESILYYPYYGNKIKNHESKIVINNQEFVFDGYIDITFVKFYKFRYKNQLFLILTTPLGKYGDFEAFIFDVTNIDNIFFYPAEDRFVEKDFGEYFVGLYQNKLCFFFSKRRFDWNGQYELSPYYIVDASLKQLCNKKGKPYFINYKYKDKFEQEFIIEEKNYQ